MNALLFVVVCALSGQTQLPPVPGPLSAPSGGGGSGGGVSGGGASGRVAFWTGATTLSSSGNLLWDDTNAIFTTQNTSSANTASVYILNDAGHRNGLGMYGTTYPGTPTIFSQSTTDAGTVICTNCTRYLIGTDTTAPVIFGESNAEIFRISTSKEMLFGTTTDPGAATATATFVTGGFQEAIIAQTSVNNRDGGMLALNETGGGQFYIEQNGTLSPDGYFGLSGNNLSKILSFQASALGIGTLDGKAVVIGTNNTERVRWTSGGTEVHKAQTLETCSSTIEWGVAADAASGVSTAHRSRLCMCTSNGSATYAWQNIVSGTVGTTTTCSD